MLLLYVECHKRMGEGQKARERIDPKTGAMGRVLSLVASASVRASAGKVMFCLFVI